MAAMASDRPAVSIDSSLLGGMFANTIRLVGTETGVGVNLDGKMATNTGDITLSANGDVTMDTAVAAQALDVKSVSGDVSVKTLVYGDSVELDAGGSIDNQGTIASIRSMGQKAKSISNQGDFIAGLNTDGSLNADANINLSSDTLLNGGQFIATGNISISAPTIDNNEGLVEAIAGNIVLDKVTELKNSSGSIQAGSDISLTIEAFEPGLEKNLVTDNNLSINVDEFNNVDSFSSGANVILNVSGTFQNRGEFSAVGGYEITATRISNQADAKLITDGVASLSTTNGDLENDGVITAAGSLSIRSSNNIINHDVIGSGDSLELLANDAIENGDDTTGSLLFSIGDMRLLSDSLTNRYADIYSFGNLTVAKDDAGSANSGVLNSSSVMEAVSNVSITSELFENRRDPIVLTDNGDACNGQSGIALCQDNILGGEEFGIPSSTPLSKAWLFKEALEVNSGRVENQYIAGQNILKQLSLAASRTPRVNAGKNIDMNVGGFVNQGGLISAANDVTINANDFVNETVVAATLGPAGVSGPYPYVGFHRNYYSARGNLITSTNTIFDVYLGAAQFVENSQFEGVNPIIVGIGGSDVFTGDDTIIVRPNGEISLPGEFRFPFFDTPSRLAYTGGELVITDARTGVKSNITLDRVDSYLNKNSNGEFSLTLGSDTYDVSVEADGKLTAKFDNRNLPVEFAVQEHLRDYTTTAESTVDSLSDDFGLIPGKLRSRSSPTEKPAAFSPEIGIENQIIDTTFFPGKIEAGNILTINATNTISNGLSGQATVQPSQPPQVVLQKASVPIPLHTSFSHS